MIPAEITTKKRYFPEKKDHAFFFLKLFMFLLSLNEHVQSSQRILKSFMLNESFSYLMNTPCSPTALT